MLLLVTSASSTEIDLVVDLSRGHFLGGTPALRTLYLINVIVALPQLNSTPASPRHISMRNHLPNVPILTLKIESPPSARMIALPIRPRPRPASERHAFVVDALERRIKLLVRRWEGAVVGTWVIRIVEVQHLGDCPRYGTLQGSHRASASDPKRAGRLACLYRHHFGFGFDRSALRSWLSTQS